MPDQSSAATEHAILAEITRPLEALPDDPLAVVDADFPTSLRGYDRVAVDAYVRHTRRLVAELQATRSPEAAVRRALERVGEQISGILQRAHETAEQITAQSRSEAEDRLEQARVEAAHIAGGAEQRVRELDVDTDRIWLERQRIVADAEDLAAQLLALAKTAAERFPADAEAAGTEAAEAEAVEVEAIEAAPGTEGYDDEDPAPATEGYDDEDPAPATDAYNDEDDLSEELDDRSEIERTVAFQPLDAEGQGDAAEREEAAADADRDDASSARGGTSDDDTAIIPPASQAANRRHNQ